MSYEHLFNAQQKAMYNWTMALFWVQKTVWWHGAIQTDKRLKIDSGTAYKGLDQARSFSAGYLNQIYSGR